MIPGEVPDEGPLPISTRYWERVISAIKSPERLLVELITNSTDSYKRSQKSGSTSAGTVLIEYNSTSDGAQIQVKDDAEGISLEKLYRALHYGEDTSGLSEGHPVRGSIGIGLKDVGIVMRDCRIISVRNGMLNECAIYLEKGRPHFKFLRKNELVNSLERKKLGIEKNGTIVRGLIPSGDFPTENFETLHKNLCRHYMLRKINQSSQYRIVLRSGRSRDAVIDYAPPRGEPLLEKEFYIPYDSVNFPIRLLIKRADRKLTQAGEFREGGLVVIYNEDAVADCSLFGFDGDPYAGRLYGEIEINADPFKILKLFTPKSSIIDEKRRKGLDELHPFVQELTSTVRTYLKQFIERERKAVEKLRRPIIKSVAALDRVIREFNRIARSELKELEEALIPPPGWTYPDYFKFYHDDLNIPEYESITVGLGINPQKVPHASEIIITSSDPRVKVTPNIVTVDSTKATGLIPLIKEKVAFLGEEVGTRATVTAKFGEMTDKMTASVCENPRLNPNGGFAFMPPEMKMPDDKKRNAILIVDATLIKREEENKISLVSSNPKISCQSEIRLPSNLEVIGSRVAILEVPIRGRGLGEKGIVSAFYRGRQANLNVEVAEHKKEYGGMFTNFDYLSEDAPTISEYDPPTGVISVNRTHPSFKKHEDIGWPTLKIFVVDVIIRKMCEAIVSRMIQRGAFGYLADDPSQVMTEVFIKIEGLYHKYGAHLHDLLMKCVKKPP